MTAVLKRKAKLKPNQALIGLYPKTINSPSDGIRHVEKERANAGAAHKSSTRGTLAVIRFSFVDVKLTADCGGTLVPQYGGSGVMRWQPEGGF